MRIQLTGARDFVLAAPSRDALAGDIEALKARHGGRMRELL